MECFHHDSCTLKEEISACGKEDSTKKIEVSKKIRSGKCKGCNRLSILTAGNSKCSRFANIGHVDGDICDPLIQDAAIDVLKKIATHNSCKNIFHERIMEHLKRIYSKQNGFHHYTTCGYKMMMRNKKKKKIPLAYFYITH